MSEYAENAMDLSELDALWDDVEPEEKKEIGEVPSGKYQVRVEKVYLKTSKTGKPMLAWQLRIVGGQYENQCLFRNNMLCSAENLKWLKTDLQTCGVFISGPSELKKQEVLTELLDIVLEVTKKVNGDYDNIYLNSRVDCFPETASCPF